MILKKILAVVYGIIFGITNIIPGVSGGTMMVVFGCYDIVCDALALDFKSIKKNLPFLIPFAIGAASGIIGFSFVTAFLLDNYPVPSYLFFVGLILGSIPLILRNATLKGKFKSSSIAPFLIAMFLVVLMGIFQTSDNENNDVTVTQTLSPDRPRVIIVRVTNNTNQTISNWVLTFEDGMVDKVGGAEMYYNTGTFEKIASFFSGGDEEEKEANAFSGEDENKKLAPKQSAVFTYTSKSGINLELKSQISYEADYVIMVKILFGAFVAAIAMIIPGVSGSFIMMLIGIYATVISAIKDLNFLILIPTAVGVLSGMILGAKIIKWLLENHYLLVYSIIMGLVIGSVFVVFPKDISFNIQTVIGLGTLIFGAAISLTVGMEKRSDDDLRKTDKNLK